MRPQPISMFGPLLRRLMVTILPLVTCSGQSSFFSDSGASTDIINDTVDTDTPAEDSSAVDGSVEDMAAVDGSGEDSHESDSTIRDLLDRDSPTDPDREITSADSDPDDRHDGNEEPAEGQRGSGTWADPFIIDHFPFSHGDDTRYSSQRRIDAYGCAIDTDESGPEVVYRLYPPSDGIVLASIDDTELDGVDVDLHLLGSDDPTSCLARGHTEVGYHLSSADDYYLVIDSWVNSSDLELAGPYLLTVEQVETPSGPCSLETDPIEMFNRDEPLPMPAFGPVVMEAHLVTTSEFPGSWPTAIRDGIPEHYTLSQSVTGYEMVRSEPWAPEGEGGSQWGQGSTSRPPSLDEAWYVNMYWRNRPAQGTRMLVNNPTNGRAVVTAGGYETGPGAASAIGGACEEIHDHLDSHHRTPLLMGFLVDQDLPLGPITCVE